MLFFLPKKYIQKKKTFVDKFHWIFIIWWSVIFDETTLCLNQPYKFLDFLRIKKSIRPDSDLFCWNRRDNRYLHGAPVQIQTLVFLLSNHL